MQHFAAIVPPREENLMKLNAYGLLAAVSLGAMSLATPAFAQVTLKIWSIDGVHLRYL